MAATEKDEALMTLFLQNCMAAPRDLDELHFGTVQMVHDVKGFAMVACPHSEFGRDVYVHPYIVENWAPLVKDDVCAFKVHMNTRGMPQASAPLWKAVGKLKEGEELKFGHYVGTVANFTKTGHAIIECPDLKEAGEKAPLMHHSVLQPCGLVIGDIVCFNSVVGETVRWVSSPCWRCCSSMLALAGREVREAHEAQVPGAAQWGAPAWGDGKSRDNGKGDGKCWDNGKGGDAWGKGAQHNAVASSPGRTKMKLCTFWQSGTCTKGAECTYAHGEHELGTPQRPGDAKGGGKSNGKGGAVEYTSSSGMKVVMKGSTMRLSDEALSQIKSGNLQPQQPQQFQAARPVHRQRMRIQNLAHAELVLRSKALHVGKIKKVGESFGMVDCPDSGFEKDLYLHWKVVEPDSLLTVLKEGDLVAFEIHLSKDGRPQVSAPLWKHCGYSKKDAPLEFGEFLGQVSEVNAAGFGKVDCPTVVDMHGQAAQIHSKIAEACGLSPGDLMAFSVHAGDSGVPWVSAPCWRCCSNEKYIDQWSKAEIPHGDIDIMRALSALEPELAEPEAKRQRLE